MTSGLVSELLTNLGITRSHSRPRVSNDNPYSEVQLKTLKYLHNFPKSFASLDDARVFLEGFFNECNHIHCHSGIAWLPQRRCISGLPRGSTKPARSL
ncbi:integrase core domain-containing protein (plasmid) [Rhodococcus globerulus]|uniref:integrase core domain-containing protein n=1 Tax=Rhodococcus globerulus TaxID=33008 RepID=UPI0039EA2A0E